MPVEKSAGAIVFRRGKGTILYLLLHYQASHWDFPKGHIEKGESEEEALRREVFEETGIKDLELIPGFRKRIKYFFKAYPRGRAKKNKRETVLKFVVFYLAETKTKNVRISFEHIGYQWLPYERAMEQLTFENARGILRKAARFLAGKER